MLVKALNLLQLGVLRYLPTLVHSFPHQGRVMSKLRGLNHLDHCFSHIIRMTYVEIKEDINNLVSDTGLSPQV